MNKERKPIKEVFQSVLNRFADVRNNDKRIEEIRNLAFVFYLVTAKTEEITAFLEEIGWSMQDFETEVEDYVTNLFPELVNL